MEVNERVVGLEIAVTALLAELLRRSPEGSEILRTVGENFDAIWIEAATRREGDQLAMMGYISQARSVLDSVQEAFDRPAETT